MLDIKFDEKGLVPAVIQDAVTGGGADDGLYECHVSEGDGRYGQDGFLQQKQAGVMAQGGNVRTCAKGQGNSGLIVTATAF